MRVTRMTLIDVAFSQYCLAEFRNGAAAVYA
jgi:hypothetical protein